MGPSFLEGCPIMYRSSPSVCLPVRPSVRPVPPPRGKTKKPRKTKLGRKGPWDTSIPWTNFKKFELMLTRRARIYSSSVSPVSPPRGKTKRPTKTKLGRKGPWDTSTPWTNFKKFELMLTRRAKAYSGSRTAP